jgi:hypothetical protein
MYKILQLYLDERLKKRKGMGFSFGSCNYSDGQVTIRESETDHRIASKG